MIDQSCWTEIFGFGIRVEGLGEDNYTLSIDIVGFEEFTQDNLGFTIRVYVGCVE